MCLRGSETRSEKDFEKEKLGEELMGWTLRCNGILNEGEQW